VEGSEANIKVTTMADLEYFRYLRSAAAATTTTER